MARIAYICALASGRWAFAAFVLFCTLAPAVAFAQRGRAAGELHLYDGRDGRTYLGCLTCHAAHRDAVANDAGRYGSPVEPRSIRNRVERYGSPVDPTSACNPVAPAPPRVVDAQGRYYGRLTLNAGHPEAIRDPRFMDWLARLCAG